MSVYKLAYEEIDNDLNSKSYGFLVTRNRKFKNFNEAVNFYRNIANNTNMIGKPLIVIED